MEWSMIDEELVPSYTLFSYNLRIRFYQATVSFLSEIPYC